MTAFGGLLDLRADELTSYATLVVSDCPICKPDPIAEQCISPSETKRAAIFGAVVFGMLSVIALGMMAVFNLINR